ncbi:hypothetical protein [Bacteroides sp. 224]|uniref:hypothetical protein n=1 Tax=Bacteroides sp. 224 TaxID=2302936 RepID=UPI0013D4FD07|nr:hypothetical protein [Bacteroides sp. 224]NDV66911.1 hypothetical protein [Bacteroides sp. 224]
MEYKKEFLKFAESLKLNQKAELLDDEGNNLINDIYTDLFPENAVNDKINLPNTTVIIGRKGTGKSTIFQKSINDQISNNKVFPLYLDVKTIYDRATPTLQYEDKTYVSKNELTKFLLYKNFLKEVILEIKRRIEKHLSFNWFEIAFGINTENLMSIQEKLDAIEENLNNSFEQIDINLFTRIGSELEATNESQTSISANISQNPGLSLTSKNGRSQKIKEEFNSVFINYINIKQLLIDNFLSIKEILEIKNIYIFLDDFSEIDYDAQVLFIDYLIAPLNNLSENFVKFKIATYRGRLYLGKIDRSKIDFIHLDFFEAYNIYKSISKMEELAVDYNKRLIHMRSKFFFKNSSFYDYFDIKKEDLHDLLFEISMNIPRKLGYLLSYCYESSLIHNQKITKAILGNASQRYYEEVTESYFEANPYIIRPFSDKVNIANQLSLLEKIVNKQKFNKQNIAKSKAKLFNVLDQPTSHFVVNEDFSSLLNNLELNGFISTYNKLKDKSNISSTLFALDYGLCRKYNLNYGRPKDADHRKYYSDSRFSLNHIIREHFNSTQVLVCSNGHEFSFELIKQFELYEMNCPTCLKEGTINKCKVAVSSKELVDKIKEIERTSLLLVDFDEFRILYVLSQFSPVSLPVKKLGELNDMSSQFIAKRVPKLIELGFIEIDEEKSLVLRKDHYLITAKAKENVIDFIVNQAEEINIIEEEDTDLE